MLLEGERDELTLKIAQQWCSSRGAGWMVKGEAGRGGTATVFDIASPDGDRTLKIYDAEYSGGKKGQIEAARIEQQVSLGVHDCPSLVKIYDGGTFHERHFLLMSRAPGQELEKRLSAVPREKIRSIVDQIARACIFLRGKGYCHRDIKSANIFVSDDFEQATLLDLSVTREISDHVGVGTDHDGQLPVVATARYSPPEYLFRLLEPGEKLWHALDVYQLGALLHDLIVRQPLFQDEYAQSRENRYRFAWIVATAEPRIVAADVDQDLLFIARRALDKTWERRSSLTLNDFLDEAATRQARALETLGLSKRTGDRVPTPGASIARVREVAVALEERIREYLREQGITARHEVLPGANDNSNVVQFSALGGREPFKDLIYIIHISLVESGGRRIFEGDAVLSATVNGTSRQASIRLPPIDDGETATDRLGTQAEQVIAPLAAALVSQTEGG